ncbi:MAG: ribulose-phosphate 3-epimerase [Bdellovibrio sp.]
MIISPSLLACDFLNIESEIKSLDEISNLWLHLDIMDGHFVPNLTFGHPIVEMISKKTKIPLDAHFMVTNPEFYLETFKNYNIYNFTFHIEATSNPLDLIKEAKKTYKSVGVSIKPKTSLETLSDDILATIDLVLVMTVEPGFGGQKFMHDCVSKITALKKIKHERSLSFSIQVDGGINNETASICRNAGADNLVAGSYIFSKNSFEYKNVIDSLRGSI